MVYSRDSTIVIPRDRSVSTCMRQVALEFSVDFSLSRVWVWRVVSAGPASLPRREAWLDAFQNRFVLRIALNNLYAADQSIVVG